MHSTRLDRRSFPAFDDKLRAKHQAEGLRKQAFRAVWLYYEIMRSDPRGEKQVWQKRFWEHVIRDEVDWRNHVDYIHYNPVRHGYAVSPGAWRYSSFSRAMRHGWYDEDWGRSAPVNIAGMDCE